MAYETFNSIMLVLIFLLLVGFIIVTIIYAFIPIQEMKQKIDQAITTVEKTSTDVDNLVNTVSPIISNIQTDICKVSWLKTIFPSLCPTS